MLNVCPAFISFSVNVPAADLTQITVCLFFPGIKVYVDYKQGFSMPFVSCLAQMHSSILLLHLCFSLLHSHERKGKKSQ